VVNQYTNNRTTTFVVLRSLLALQHSPR